MTYDMSCSRDTHGRCHAAETRIRYVLQQRHAWKMSSIISCMHEVMHHRAQVYMWRASRRALSSLCHITHCNTLQHAASRCITLHHSATHCCNFAYVDAAYPLTHATRTCLINTCHTHMPHTHMPHTHVCLRPPRRTDLRHNTLQHAATRCNTLQHTATHCNIAVIESGLVDDATAQMCDATMQQHRCVTRRCNSTDV